VKLEKLPKGVRLAVEAAQEKKGGRDYRAGLERLERVHGVFRDLHGIQHAAMQAICSEVEDVLYQRDERSPEHREGRRSAEWALLDFGGFIVHVFGDQARRYYDLERLWRQAPSLVLPDEPETHRRNELSEKAG